MIFFFLFSPSLPVQVNIFDADQYRDYFWNDSDCKNDVAHYICVKVLNISLNNTFNF